MCIMKFHVLTLHVMVTCSIFKAIFLVNYSFIYKMQCRFEYLDFLLKNSKFNFVRHMSNYNCYILKILHTLCTFIIHIKVCIALKSIKILKNISKTLFFKKSGFSGFSGCLRGIPVVKSPTDTSFYISHMLCHNLIITSDHKCMLMHVSNQTAD